MTASVQTTDPYKLVQHYSVWREFNKKVYQRTLTSEDIIMNGNEKHVTTVIKLFNENGKVYVQKEFHPVNRKCIFLEKNGIKYILPSEYKNKLPLNVKEGYECYIKKTDPTVHIFIEEPTIAKITGVKTLSFKQLIDAFNPMLSTDPKTFNFLKIMEFASSHKGTKCCICSCPESGKNSNGTIFRYITNNVVRVGKPTLAKLETLFYYNQKVYPDEMTSLTPANVREVEPFFLTIADESPDFTKHSMARNKELNNININNASCIFTYNRPQDLNADAQFFDEIWQNLGAFKNRYVQLLLPESRIIEELPKLNVTQAREIMDKGYERLRVLAKNIIYYINNLDKEMHHWKRDKCNIKYTRHKTNFQAVLDALDVYSESQEEYNRWLEWVSSCINNYKKMIYNKNVESGKLV